MMSLDLSSVYLQVELDKDSRKYMAFLFDSTVYQFESHMVFRTPCWLLSEH
jgi:hypothetical protein